MAKKTSKAPAIPAELVGAGAKKQGKAAPGEGGGGPIAEMAKLPMEERGPRPLPAPQAARVATVPKLVLLHATQLYPHLAENIDPVTGTPLPGRERTGGQYSARRLALINRYKPNEPARFVALPLNIDPSGYPLKTFERYSDPERFPDSDKEPGTVEIVFDFEDQMLEYLAANGITPGFDPLAKNDLDPTKFPPNLKLPGGSPTG